MGQSAEFAANGSPENEKKGVEVKLEPRGKFYTVTRLFVGLIFVANGSLGLIDPSLTRPDFYRESGLQFISALEASGYLMYVVKVIEALVGVALLANRFIPLALVVLAPILFNIVAVNILFWPSLAAAVPTMMILVAPIAYLAFAHHQSYSPLFRSVPCSEQLLDKSRAYAASSGPESGEAV